MVAASARAVAKALRKPVLYLVSETKSSTSKDDMRPDEWRKIQCGAALKWTRLSRPQNVIS